MKLNRKPLDRGWLFAVTEDEQACMPGYDDSGWLKVTLPHDWQISQSRRADAPGGSSQGYFPREQMGVYRLHFKAASAWRGKLLRVLFDGVQRFCEVYLNGIRVGGHAYGYTPFTVDLTQAVVYDGENLLALRVDNRAFPGEANSGGDRWYSGAGIIRDVWLTADEPVNLIHDGLRVVSQPVRPHLNGDEPNGTAMRYEESLTEVSAEIGGDCGGRNITLKVTAPDGSIVYEQTVPAQEVTRWNFSIKEPVLWSTDSPALYRAKVTFGIDSVETAFGVRSAVFDGEDGFLLNGVKTKLWGVNLHHDGGAVGAAVPREIWERRLRSLKKMGVNTVRCAHHPMPEYFYDICDEMGFLCVDELMDKWEGCGMYFDRCWSERFADLSAMIRRDANHPCVILWSVGNEVSHQFSEKFFAYLKELTDAVRTLDTTRAVSCVLISCVLKDYNDLTPMGVKLAALKRYSEYVDVFCGNYMEHYYEKMREYGIRKPVLGTETTMLYRKDERALNNVQISPESPYEIVSKYDWVCGAILWAGIDYIGEAHLWPHRGWTGSALDTTGDWKLRAWYMASRFKREPVLKICVYDESEPWDGARSMWSFPQMRSHWEYGRYDKMMHVAVLTNCEKVLLYLNDQTPRWGYLKDHPDGIIHFNVPFIPGVLRVEGYEGSTKVIEDALYSDRGTETVRIETGRKEIPADGRSVVMADLYMEDGHGHRYMLKDRDVTVTTAGVPVTVLMDNGDPWDIQSFECDSCPTHDGHLLILIKAGLNPGKVTVTIKTDGMSAETLEVDLTAPETVYE